MSETPTAAGGTELVALDDAKVEQALRGELEEAEVLAIEDPQAVQLDIIKRILESPDADAILAGRQPVHGRDILDRAFNLTDVRWHRSKFEGIVPVFAVLQATFLDDGETAAVTTGAGSVMAQAYALKKMGALPVDVKLVESSQETAAGYRPQWLVRA